MDPSIGDFPELLTYSTVQITAISLEGERSYGTGFFMNLFSGESDIPLLITCAHVVKKSQKISIDLCLTGDNGEPIDTEVYNFELDSSRWVFHPEEDICYMIIYDVRSKIANNGNPVYYKALQFGHIPQMDNIERMMAIENVFMIGYPKNRSDYVNHKPIVRAGITATAFSKDYNGEKKFLIDCPCFTGSSGSPIVLFDAISYYDNKEKRPVSHPRFHFLGVLSENINASLELDEESKEESSPYLYQMNLGVVLKSEILNDFKLELDSSLSKF